MSDPLYPAHASARVAPGPDEWNRAIAAAADYVQAIQRRVEAHGPTASVVKWESDVDLAAAIRRLAR